MGDDGDIAALELLTAKLAKVQEIDAAAAIAKVGGVKNYLTALRKANRDMVDLTASIWDFQDEKNWNDYSVHVQTAKDVLSLIGAYDLEKLAETLAAASKSGNYQICVKKTEEFVNNMLILQDQISFILSLDFEAAYRSNNQNNDQTEFKTILAVDDMKSNLAIIEESLKEDFNVKTTTSPEEALNMLDDVDLMLLDIEMPGMSGFQLLTVIKENEKTKHIPAIFVTSHATGRLIAHAKRVGACDYIVKPFSAQMLLNKVITALDSSFVMEEMYPYINALTETKTQYNFKRAILVIDDNLNTLKQMEILLSDDYEVSLAKSGERGLQIAASTQPDLILLDYEMPGMNGIETCKRLKESPQLSKIPVIFLSGNRDTEIEIAGLEAGAKDFLVKPVSKEFLLNKIKHYLDIQ
ncbi:hypothetical protein AGMMS50212_09390 [Spirochaetia bacterium]|nr:hypothetical protein AGMMS50212_09390 [Spirochaetia bacterium]